MFKVIIGLMFLLSALWFANQQDFFTPESPVKQNTALIQAGEKCANIATNAVAKLVVVVEFQKLEVAGRKARVMRQCMEDHGYIENPAWLNHFMPQVQKTVQVSDISENEATENLRRSSMYRFDVIKNTPAYWQKSTATAKPMQ